MISQFKFINIFIILIYTNRYMLAKGAKLDLHSENGQGPRPIHWASRNGHVAVVDILLSVRIPGYIFIFVNKKRLNEI